MAPPELVVLDLAGTLLDDAGVVLDAFAVALDRGGIPVERDQLNAVRGANKLQVFRTFAGRALGPGPEAVRAAHESLAVFNEELSARFRDGPLELFAGVSDALEAIRSAGIKLVTNTGFTRDIADAVLVRLRRQLGLFDAHVCGDDVPAGRPAPYMIFLAMERAGVSNVHRVLAVGDTPLDLQAGTNAGAAGVVGVLTGTHDWASLGATRHTHLIPSVADLPDLLRTEFEAAIAAPPAASTDTVG